MTSQDPTGLADPPDPQSHPLWPYREAALLKHLPVGIIDEIIQKDPNRTVQIKPTSNVLPYYQPFWNDIRLPTLQHETPPTKWTIGEWPRFYNELFHADWDLHIAVGEPTFPYREHIAPYTQNYRILPQPFVAQEEAYSETADAYINAVYRNENMFGVKIDLSQIENLLRPVSHEETFGAEAENVYSTAQEFNEIILPILNGSFAK